MPIDRDLKSQYIPNEKSQSSFFTILTGSYLFLVRRRILPHRLHDASRSDLGSSATLHLNPSNQNQNVSINICQNPQHSLALWGISSAVERPLCMREAPGSNPGFSIFFLRERTNNTSFSFTIVERGKKGYHRKTFLRPKSGTRFWNSKGKGKGKDRDPNRIGYSVQYHSPSVH